MDTSNGVLQTPLPAQEETSRSSGKLTFAPEDFKLEAGVHSHIDRDSPVAAEDVFRCSSCTEPVCQVSVDRGKKKAAHSQ